MDRYRQNFPLKQRRSIYETAQSRIFAETICRSPSYGVYIFQLIRFARACSYDDDFNMRQLFLSAKLLKQGYRYHKIRKAFSKFYHRHSELIVKYNIGLKTLLQQGISEPIFYGDLVYNMNSNELLENPNLSDQFKKLVKRYIRCFVSWGTVLECISKAQ